MAIEYNFKYMPLVGKLSGESMVKQTETAINEIAKIVNDNTAQAEIINTLAEQANANSVEALEKATEALDTSSRVYVKETLAVNLNSYCESQLIYINNVFSQNLPVAHKGFLEVKTNDDKTQATQVFADDVNRKFYVRTGAITATTVGDVTTYTASYGTWVDIPNITDLDNYLALAGGTMSGDIEFSASGWKIKGSDIDNDAELSIVGATDNLNGSSLNLYGRNHTKNGSFELNANNGTYTKTLKGTATGNLTWDGNVNADNFVGGGTMITGTASVDGVVSVKNGSNTAVNTLQRSTAYSVDDIVYTSEINAKYYLLCTTAGTTASTLPSFANVESNTQITDGTVVWRVQTVTSQEKAAGFPVGFEYFSMNPNIPQGSLPLFGGEYSRETYADLWTWVQAQSGYLKTEADWQDLATANNGNVPYYSSGDGSTTFRVPSLRCWVKGADGTVVEVGSYLEAGLPNITGTYSVRLLENQYDVILSPSDVFRSNRDVYGQNGGMAGQSGTTTDAQKITFDASRSSSIYGNSTTVQPKSIVGMWLVKAYGTVVDTGQIDEQQYIDDRIATRLPLLGGTMNGNIAWTKGEIGYRTNTHTDPLVSCRQIIVTAGKVDSEWNDGNAKLALHTFDSTGVNTAENGGFDLLASDGTNSASLTGRPGGSLTWANKDVERVNAKSGSSIGYIRFESGLQIVFGGDSATSSGKVITFPVAFNGTNYRTAITPMGTSIGVGWGTATSTSLKFQTSSTNTPASFEYIIVGWWK